MALSPKTVWLTSQRHRQGGVERALYERPRPGKAALLGAQDRQRIPKVTPDRSSSAFADYLLDMAVRYAETDTIHLVLDNLNSHSRMAVVERFGGQAGDWPWRRFTVRYTPKHGSWLNQAEIVISLFSRQCLGRRRIGDRSSLRAETRAWSRSYEPP